jgi:hypothetical protein
MHLCERAMILPYFLLQIQCIVEHSSSLVRRQEYGIRQLEQPYSLPSWPF